MWRSKNEITISGINSYESTKNNQIRLKTSQISFPKHDFSALADQEILDKVFSGKKFSDKVYGYKDMTSVSQVVKRTPEGIEAKREENFINEKGEAYARLSRVIIFQNQFFDAELIWPKKDESFVRSVLLIPFEKMNVL